MYFKPHNTRFKVTAATALLLLLTSCSTKPCRCYLLTRWGSVRVSETYIDRDTPCSELGYDRPSPDDSSFRYCTEIEIAEMDTMDIVRMFWGKQQ